MGAGTAQRGACLLISGKVRKNMEFVVFAGVLLLLFIFMIVQELIQTKNQEKLFKKYLRENYGKEPPKEYSLERFARLGSYLERHKEEKQLDDITWNDLGMDEGLRSVGWHKERSNQEEHLYNPETIHLLQQATWRDDYNLFKQYTACVNAEDRHITLRSTLDFKFAEDGGIPMEEVESVESIMRRFKTGAMS